MVKICVKWLTGVGVKSVKLLTGGRENKCKMGIR